MAMKWQIRMYMAQVASEYVSAATGEVNATGIAKAACEHFNIANADVVFDWAVVAAENHEALYQTVDAADVDAAD